MKEWTVLYKKNNVVVYATTVIAYNEDEAVRGTEFKPFFIGIEYDSWEAFVC